MDSLVFVCHLFMHYTLAQLLALLIMNLYLLFTDQYNKVSILLLCFYFNSAMGWRFRPAHYATDGLNTLVYTQKAVELRPLYYWLFISLPPPPHNFKAYSRTYRALSAGSAQPIVDLTAVGCAVFVAVLPSLFS